MITVTPEEIREEIDHAVKTCEPWILDVVEDAIAIVRDWRDIELIIAHIIDRMALRDPTVNDGDYIYSRDGGFASIWFSGTDDSEIDRASLVLFGAAQRQHHTGMINVGDMCIYCDRSTSFGSGRFVNRIPADDGELDGWMCAECQFPEVCFSCEEEKPMAGEMLCKSCHQGGEL